MSDRTQKIWVVGLLSINLAATSLSGSVQAEGLGSNDMLDHIYLSGHVGFANSHTDLDEVQNAFNQAGVNATVLSVDDTQLGFGLGLGYAITPEWSVELSYLDMDQVNVEFTAIQAVNNLEQIHPESGNGITLSGLYRHAIDEKAHLRVRGGVFNWKADYQTVIGPGGQVATDSDSGTDLYWGVGFGQTITKGLKLTTEVQRFEFDNKHRNYVRVGIEWRCEC